MITLSPIEFLSRVWPARLVREERLELRALDRKKDEVKREFFDSIQSFLKGAQSYKDKDVYFGVSTRYGIGAGKKSDCFRVNAVWVDFDGIKFSECREVSPRPNIIVETGGGCHGYWLLSTSVVVRDPDRIKHFEAINRGLCQRFGGDKMAIDITRILRVPGYSNHKYSPPFLIDKVHLLHEKLYPLEFFKRHGIYKERKDEDNGEEIEEGRIIRDISTRIKNQLNTVGGSDYDGDKSRQDSAIITALLNHGLDPEDAYATFSASRRGDDAKERKEGHYEDYMMRTIRKASSYIKKSASNGHIPIPSQDTPRPNGKLVVDFGKRQSVVDMEDGIITRKANQIEVETVRWLWPGYLPAGRITLMAGNPGEGKSTISIDLVSRISRGTFLPFYGRTVSGNCVIASAEDAAEDTIVPRLIASGADLNKVEIMRQVMVEGERRYLSFPRDLNALRELIVKRGARLVIIDPFSAFLTKDTDSHKDQDVRSILAPVEDIAEETGASILIIAHLNKKEESSALFRVGGSIGIVGAARSVLGVQQMPEKQTRVLYSLKSNLAKKPAALEYETVSVSKNRNGSGGWLGDENIKSSRVKWIGEVDFDPVAGAIAQTDAETAAMAFLKQIIFDSEVRTDEIFREAKAAGVPRGQLIRLRETIGIKARKAKDGKWLWSWPEPS